MLAKIPIKYPETIAAIKSTGKYTYILKSLIMKAATSSCPTLWKTAPQTLMVGILNEFLKYLYSNIITILLRTPPAMLNIKADMLPPKIEPNIVLKIIIKNASFHPSKINATNDIELASPNFIPGNNTGI